MQRLTHWLETNGFNAAEINAQDAMGFTALMRAAKDAETDVARELLSLDGIDVNKKNIDGNNALWLACFSRSQKIAEMLVDAGVELDNINENGVTALMYTASSGNEAMTRFLLEKGADARIKNLDGFTALDLASTINIVKMLRPLK
jgi:ankyrin repeat protein